MLTTRLLVLAVLLAALGPVRADMWTNQAGRVIEARLKEFDGVWVTLVRTNSSTLRLPLSALCKTDQRRVRAQKSQSIAPGFVQAAYKDAVGILERFQRLPADQQTAEGREKAVHMACSVFDARVNARSAELTDKDVLYEVRRLRASLANRAQ
jgi:hypothetical protein